MLVIRQSETPRGNEPCALCGDQIGIFGIRTLLVTTEEGRGVCSPCTRQHWPEGESVIWHQAEMLALPTFAPGRATKMKVTR